VQLLRRPYGTGGDVGVAIPRANRSAAGSVDVASSGGAAEVDVDVDVAAGDRAPWSKSISADFQASKPAMRNRLLPPRHATV
jgi:hypothetical protein